MKTTKAALKRQKRLLTRSLRLRRLLKSLLLTMPKKLGKAGKLRCAAFNIYYVCAN